MPKKRKTLPKDFDELIKSNDIATLKAIFDKCEIDAYGGYGKQSALGFNDCPDELSEWLVGNGADIHFLNTYGDTPLHLRASSRYPNLDMLIKLGADVNYRNKSGNTPLHSATAYQKPENAEILLAAGSDINAVNSSGLNPLEYGLQRCNNIDIPRMCELIEVFLKRGAEITPRMLEFVKAIGERFEFHRDSFNKDRVDEYSNALTKLYSLFHVTPVQARIVHDGKSTIELTGNTWEQNYDNLWDYLIPSKGPALTVQGEVIRIAGRVADELLRNGGGNWDGAYRQMCNAYIKHISSHNSLEEDEISILKELISDIDILIDETSQLQKYAVKWVSKNINPIKLGKPSYDR
ncbi:ankyrin repeat domain-containing protein [Microbulbifer sp. ZKSA002]|uniref:ankyrin repeat domain-containing protein n=1 Tax=Microbulbifer sp. ZKSA002 TaxID=3243388 RepID=UPI00403A4A2F